MELSLVTALLFVALATINSIADAAKATKEVNRMSAQQTGNRILKATMMFKGTTLKAAVNKIGVAALVCCSYASRDAPAHKLSIPPLTSRREIRSYYPPILFPKSLEYSLTPPSASPSPDRCAVRLSTKNRSGYLDRRAIQLA